MTTVQLTYWQRVKLASLRRPSRWERGLAWMAVVLSALVVAGRLLSHQPLSGYWATLSYALCWLLAEYQRLWAHRYGAFKVQS